MICRPETERLSHYFHCRLPEQFDWVIHIDATSALEPLERWPQARAREEGEKYPAGV